jgi:hypothetical protein
MREFVSALIGGVTAAALGIGADFFITYKLVDAPKVQMERQRILLDAHREISQLAPVVLHDCIVALDKDVPTAHVQCDLTNGGSHNLVVSFDKIELAVVFIKSTGYERFRMEEDQSPGGKAFKVEFIDSKRTGTTIAPKQTIAFKFDIVRPGKREPDNIRLKRSEVTIRIGLTTNAVPSASKAFLDLYPELKDFIDHSSTRSSTLFVRFPPEPARSAAKRAA